MADRESVEVALSEAQSLVSRMPSTMGARELRERVEAYARTVQGWKDHAPPAEEVDALATSLREIMRIARAASPTVRFKRPTE